MGLALISNRNVCGIQSARDPLAGRCASVVDDSESAVGDRDCYMAPLYSDGNLEGLAHELSLGETQPPLPKLA